MRDPLQDRDADRHARELPVGKAGATTVCACLSSGGRRRGPGLAQVRLHRGGVAPPEHLVLAATGGRLFQPRCRDSYVPTGCGLEQPRRPWSHIPSGHSYPGVSVSLPSPRSCRRDVLFAQAGQSSRWLDCPFPLRPLDLLGRLRRRVSALALLRRGDILGVLAEAVAGIADLDEPGVLGGPVPRMMRTQEQFSRFPG
jgi:hypothetical protein